MTQNVTQLVRDMQARAGAIRSLTLMYEDQAIGEQLAHDGSCPCHPDGQPDEWVDPVPVNHHIAVLFAIRALNAEMDNPKPEGLDYEGAPT